MDGLSHLFGRLSAYGSDILIVAVPFIAIIVLLYLFVVPKNSKLGYALMAGTGILGFFMVRSRLKNAFAVESKIAQYHKEMEQERQGFFKITGSIAAFVGGYSPAAGGRCRFLLRFGGDTDQWLQFEKGITMIYLRAVFILAVAAACVGVPLEVQAQTCEQKLSQCAQRLDGCTKRNDSCLGRIDSLAGIIRTNQELWDRRIGASDSLTKNLRDQLALQSKINSIMQANVDTLKVMNEDYRKQLDKIDKLYSKELQANAMPWVLTRKGWSGCFWGLLIGAVATVGSAIALNN
jgi:hypothetical protein